MNKYEILQKIGQGEYGVVIKARNKQTSELVAIKKFKQDDTNEQNKKLMLREVKILKSIHSQNIIQLKEVFRKKGKIYLVCQFVQRNLLQILQDKKAVISPNMAKFYTYQLIKGLAYMHSHNIIHRDIKPENILISRQQKVKICDFGFARSLPPNLHMTDYVATRWYRPPELLIAMNNYDISIDMWAVGCLMTEMIDGQPLFAGENDLDQLYLIQKCLGKLVPHHFEHFLKNPKFIGMRFPDIHSLQTLERRFSGKIDKYALDLIKKMLKMNPKDRITAEQALNHPYFNSMNKKSQTFTNQQPSGELHKSKIYNRNDQLAQNETGDGNHSNPFFQASKNVCHNNFLEEKSAQQKVGLNKVTGISKMKKNLMDNISSIRGNNLMKDKVDEQQPKGKSVGSRKITNNAKFANGPITQKKIPTRIKLKTKVIDTHKPVYEEEDNYYEQKWQNIDQSPPKSEEKEPNLLQYTLKKIQKSNLNQDKQIDSPFKKDEKNKNRIARMKRQNYNIVFNNNTYNVNLVDPYN